MVSPFFTLKVVITLSGCCLFVLVGFSSIFFRVADDCNLNGSRFELSGAYAAPLPISSTCNDISMRGRICHKILLFTFPPGNNIRFVHSVAPVQGLTTRVLYSCRYWLCSSSVGYASGA